MRNLTVLGILLFVCISSTFGQNPADSIVMKKAFGGYQFYQYDKRLNMSQLVEAMQTNEQAYKEIKAAQSTYTFAAIIGGAGGFMVGWPLGTAVAGGEPNWTLAGIGAGLIVISIPISQKFNKQAKTAVNTFNDGLKTSSFLEKTELRLAFTGNGIGLTIRF
jgi:hypothetical protein